MGIFLCTSLFSCVQEAPPPLRVGFLIWPGYESLYLARDLGYYNQTAIRLVDYPSGSEIIRAFRSGDLEAATLTMYEALLVAETNPDIQIVLIMDSSNGADVVLAKPDIKTLKELKHKRVGVESGALGAFVLTRSLEKVKLTLKDVKTVSLGVSEHEQAFKTGTVDAVVTFEPTRSKLMAAGAKLLFDSSQIPGEILDVLIIRDSVAQESSAAVQKLIDGHFRALDYLKENTQDAAQRIASREGVTPTEFLESLKGINIPNLQENKQLLGDTDTLSKNRAKRVVEFMRTYKLLEKPVDLITLFEDRFVKTSEKLTHE